jgi:hypothetical protein
VAVAYQSPPRGQVKASAEAIAVALSLKVFFARHRGVCAVNSSSSDTTRETRGDMAWVVRRWVR